MNTPTRILLSLCAVLLASCASTPPETVDEPAQPVMVESSTRIVFARPAPKMSAKPGAEVAVVEYTERAGSMELASGSAPEALSPEWKARVEYENNVRPKPVTPKPAPVRQPAPVIAPAIAEIAEPAVELEEYKVTLSVESQIKIPGPGGELRVWIGAPTQAPTPGIDMTASDVLLPALGKTAKVTPFAPAFDIDPKTSVCMKIDPSGSIVRFTLVPKKEGTYKVSAEVQLFDSVDCSGAAVPKSSAILEVQVVVDKAVIKKERVSQFLKVAWDKALEFWGAALAAIGAGILVLFRKQLSKRFGIGA